MAIFRCPRCEREAPHLFPEFGPSCELCGLAWSIVGHAGDQVAEVFEVGGPLFAENEMVDPLLAEIERTTRRKAVSA